jgi:hypothetical protein
MWTCPKWLIEIPRQGPNGNSQIIYYPCHDNRFNLKIAKNIQILLFLYTSFAWFVDDIGLYFNGEILPKKKN